MSNYKKSVCFYQAQTQALDDFTIRAIWRQAFDATVEQTAILRALAASGLDVSQQSIDRAIASALRFQDSDGFNADLYRSVSRQDRLRFRNYQHELLKRERYLDEIGNGLLISSHEINFVAAMDNEERTDKLHSRYCG